LVRGNLRVLGTSDLEGAVTISNSYIMPTSDGSNLQVLSTDGNGNATWQNISAVAGYAIQADTATGGADLTLTQVGTPVDSVKFASGNNITVSRTDANTITISTNADDIPNGTAQGQVLYWNGSAWVASSNVTSAASNDRFVLQYDNSTAGANAAVFLRKNFGASTYTTGSGANIAFQVDSDSQALNQYAQIVTGYSATAPVIDLQTSIGGGTVGPYTSVASFTTAQATLPGDLAVNGGDITTTFNTGNLFNATATTVNIGNGATNEVNLGNISSGQVQIKSPTIVGANATQAVFNTVATTVNAFGAADALNMASASSLTTLGNNLSLNGDTLKINANDAGSPVDGFIYFNGTNESLKWNQANTRFEFSDQLYISQTEIPAVFERRVTTAEVASGETKGAIKILERVTDAANNNTDDAGPAVVFGRTSGATDATERTFFGIGGAWYGTTTSGALRFDWSTDNFTEAPVDQYPLTYTLLRLSNDETKFFNDSLYIDYTNVDSTKTATSITGGNTLVFGSAHGYTAGQRLLYQTATANGLVQNSYYYVIAAGLTSTQCRISTIAGGTALTLTNGTGLTLTFAIVSNRVGINTDTPTQVLDVNGNANVSGVVTVQGDAVTINSDKTDIDTYLNFGRVAPGNNAAIRWNATTDSFEWSADSTTWYDFIDVVLTSPQQGQSIIYNGTNWANSNEFEFVDFAYRSQFINGSSTAGSVVSAEFLKRRTGSLVNGNSSGIFMGQIVGTTETYTHRLVSQYESTGNNEYLIQVDPVGNFNPATTTIKTQLAVDNDDLFLNATDITLNANGAASAGVDAGLTIERGTSGGDATFKWIEANTRFEANGSIYTLGNFIADGPNIQVNADSTAADSFLYFKGTSQYLKYNNTDDQFELNNDLMVTGNVDATSITIDDTRARLDTGNSTTWATGTTITLSTTAKNVSKCLFYISDNTSGAVHTVEALALRIDATTAKLTTYGEMYSGSALATFTADVSSGSLRIRGTSTSANTLTVSIIATTLL